MPSNRPSGAGFVLDAVLNWLIPGAGYLRRGRYIRALLIFVLINGTFVAGLSLQGSVTPPIWDGSGGGIISMLTFIIQLGSGLFSGLSFFAVQGMRRMNALGFQPAPIVRFFSGWQPHATFELGSFYILVSGAMNYFFITNMYDRYRRDPLGRAIARKTARDKAS
ncbi:MAG TPA: hypothetical protein PLB62_02330 [Candidatus Sumerlaeota bacterium]|nr:hypothetical protein [Candidatus Sumerlaeota bacterium]